MDAISSKYRVHYKMLYDYGSETLAYHCVLMTFRLTSVSSHMSTATYITSRPFHYYPSLYPPYTSPLPHPILDLNLGRDNRLIVLHAPLPLLVLRHLAQAHTTPSLRIHLRKLNRRAELLALPRFADDTVELVDLFEGETFGFVYHEPHKSDADETEGAPDKEDL